MEQIKNEMFKTITNMTEDNVEETKQRIEQYFSFISISKSLWGSIPTIELPINNLEIPGTPLDNENIVETPQLDFNSYPLQRKLRGGILEMGRNKTEFIPESVIRSNEFIHGDYIKVKPHPNNRNQNIFEKVRDSDDTEGSDRIEVEFCKVSKSIEGTLTAKEQIIGGNIRLIKIDGETPFEFLINSADAATFSLKEDSIVTIAYMKSNPNYQRVTWVHHNYEENTPIPTPKLPGFYKEKSQEKHHWTPEEVKTLRGKEIVIVGADFRISDLKPLADAGQFKLHSLNGHESKSRFKAGIRNMDLVISAGAHSSHRGSEMAKEYVKKYNIPFRASPTSQSTIKKALLHGLEKPTILFHSFF